MASPSLATVLDYHQSTKHGFQRLAQGPGYLDWETQPDPFRRYRGAPLLPLTRSELAGEPLYDEIFVAEGLPPSALDRESISRLFFHSLALSAWKSAGASRWALRVNPSSGNLHPTEGYLICGPVPGLSAVPLVGHYAPREHALEVRAEPPQDLWDRLSAAFPAGTFLVGLTSIHWREAWKYGQRAYRYCQHDAGHALAALSLAAAGLGWRLRLLDDLGGRDLGVLMGTLAAGEAEPEEPEMLVAVVPARQEKVLPSGLPGEALVGFESLDWRGTPNRLSPSHRDWGLDAVVEACRKPPGRPGYAVSVAGTPSRRPLPARPRPVALERVIRQRRSAVAMDAATTLSREVFFGMLGRTLWQPDNPVSDSLPWEPHIHLALFVHRVGDLPEGLYLLVRKPSRTRELERALDPPGPWPRPAGCPETLPLYCLREGDTRQRARQISCHQEIASDGCFSLGMLAEFEAPLAAIGPWLYPRLFWEAGAIGQILYLEAEAAGIRSTGIGCYFDDPMHQVLGLRDQTYQDLYHFTLGGPVEDARLISLPAYE